MIDFIEYVVSELKSRRLSKENALNLIRQFSGAASPSAGASIIHPLLHANISDIHQQCYRSSFSGQEFFLRDHQVAAGGAAPVSVLPGVAYLEMARAAVADAMPGVAGCVSLEDVVWLKPIVVAAPCDVMIALSAAAPDARPVDFEIFSVLADEEVVHCRGTASIAVHAAPELLDIAALERRADAGQFDAGALYPAYRKMGMQFGPAHQAITSVRRGQREVVARLKLPSPLVATLAAYTLHPSLLDGALQACIGLLADLDHLAVQPSLPFALESACVFSPCTEEMIVWIRDAEGAGPADKVSRLDIDLCDSQGAVCVRLKGFSSRTLAATPQAVGLVLAEPMWLQREIVPATVPATTQHHVVLCAPVAGLAALMPEAQFHHVDAAPVEGFLDMAIDCFGKVREIVAAKGAAGVFIHIVAPDEAGEVSVALAGLLKSAALEDPSVQGQLLLSEMNADLLCRLLVAELCNAGDALVRYRAGVREVLALRELREGASAPRIAFKEGGVYLITGGLGKLGTLFAREILRQCVHAKVVLTGRAHIAALDKFPDAAGRIEYRSFDLADAGQVRALLADVVAAHGQLNGIIHSAGMIADSLIVNKSAAQCAQVLAPKVTGAINLDAASADIDLDFMALFSSGAAIMGNIGQSDYAMANGFLDQFAGYRNHLAAAGQRKGKTISINWPLWQDGGMQMPQSEQDAMRDATGMLPMRTDSGMRAFYRCLEGAQQTVVIEGETQKIRRMLFDRVQNVPVTVQEKAAADLAQPTRDYLRKQFAALFKLPYNKVDPRAALEKYGIDSILAMDLTRHLEKTFGPLSKTLFFEHQTIDELTEYFLASHGATLGGLFKAAQTAAPAAIAQSAPSTARRKLRRDAGVSAPAARADDPIAIVGLSGRYPESVDIEAFWDNLREGRDCIVEVPAARWDWREYYSEDRTAEGRHYSKWGGFISGVDEFDPLFFNIPPVDAGMIDPQERLFLQHAWMAIEDAGYTRNSLKLPHQDDLAGQVGVYVGVMYGEYQLFGAESSLQGKRVGVPVSYASIANRVSYILNLHGPSMTLDTMCSSSLTAIHLACHDLKQGRTDLAIAGGVNVTIHPNKYLILSAGQFISSDGHCQSFGEGGDGYIPGEGVGAVILKRLSEAERDGNHIYGIIKGSALNHGGKTNGYSVPNPKAQASVVGLALKEYGIDARHVSYIEAHGTGTRLGDPIEIAALSQVFGEYTKERQFCAIGSAKSNIGHCESAAGIAGLTKVLLQMKHRMIVPSLHSASLNPFIDFETTPFVVNQTLRTWEQPLVDGKTVPRIAGISSFGAGGSNAHLIIEEYPAPAMTGRSGTGEAIIVLSARTAAQLRLKAQQLAAFIERHADTLDLDALAHTLQTGREAMDMRLALVAASLEELAARLAAYGSGELGVDQCFEGQAGNDKDSLSILSEDEDMMEAIGKWIARRKLAKLAELWVNGLELDWRRLYAGRKPGLVSLPAYPFAKDRYWIARGPGGAKSGAAALHPLLHTNTSDFFEQSYASEFSGGEFFLADHQVDTGTGGRQKVLPGVACLEMVRAAVDMALPAGTPLRQLEIRNVAWSRPIVVAGLQRVAVALASNGESIIDFQVRTGDVVHCEGQTEVGQDHLQDQVDLDALKASMSEGMVSPATLYAAYAAMGIHYGPSFRCISALSRGRGQVLAELVLPGAKEHPFTLHPGLLDSALQAALGLADLANLPSQPALPFALDSITLAAPCSARMFAWVRNAPSAGAIAKIDIDLYDVHGALCVRLRGLSSRVMAAPEVGLLMAVPHWESAGPAQVPVHARHRVLLCDMPELEPEGLQAIIPGLQAKALSVAGADNAAERYWVAALACFEELQAILKDAPKEKVLFQLVVADDALLAGLSGLIATARQENPNLAAQLVLTWRGTDQAALAAQLLASAARPSEALCKHEGQAHKVRRWTPQEVPGNPKMAFRDSGAYLITGGLGGLGLLFAREILAQSASAVVVLGGRADLGDDKRAALEQLCAQLSVDPARLAYRKLDLTRIDQVQAVVADIAGQFGALHGVIHSAGTTRDGLIVNKTAAQFAAVLEPKVVGTANLDLATRDLDLDFMVLFSSLASAHGNPGQADYAAANGFLDQFAAQRSLRAKTVSINWPLWQDGGMQLDADTLELMTRASGMLPMKTASGMRAFYRSLEMDSGQLLVVEGHLERLRRSMQAPKANAEAPAVSVGASSLLEKTQAYLSEQFASLLQIPPHEVDAKAPMEKYGMDSVLAMKLTNQLERVFGSLSKTLFFEYQSIASLAGYLVTAFPGVLSEKTGASAPVAQSAAPVRIQQRFAPAPLKDDRVAIIGLGGRYPMAADLHQFWDNLKAGRDCITEIPKERWDHSAYFAPGRNQPGKAYSKWGGFMDGVDQFDALFFSISPKEAELIDPQERLFLETVWETIEDAGYSKDAIARNKVGVYVGVMWGQYELFGAAAPGNGSPSSSFASIANRVSYFFNFQGPSVALDTMCSSSLTAIHMASEEIRRGSIDIAVAGGVNLSIHPSKYLSLSQGNFASTDGRCRSFGEGGDGYVPGEGVGAVLLKSFDKALRDGDQIYAIVKASSINHGGKTNGYTVPNPVAQGQLILDVLQQAKVDPTSIGYIETHGTGTTLGDPIEITGLMKAFGEAGGKQFCPIGSVKSNIGHLEAAAGIAAVTKVLLQFKHQMLVPSLHAERLNPHIDFPATPFHVQTTLAPWTRPQDSVRRAGVSSFGAGGANAHLILEEFVESRPQAQHRDRPEALVLSARSRASLLAYAGKMAAMLERGGEASLAEIAFTSQVGRTPMLERLVVIASGKAELRAKLGMWLEQTSDAVAGVFEGKAKNTQADAGPALAGRDLPELARLWVCGVEIDWSAMNRGEQPRRVSLPAYPFVRERYWIEAGPVAATPSARGQVLHYKPEWIGASMAAGGVVGPVLMFGADAAVLVNFRMLAPHLVSANGDFGLLVDELKEAGTLPPTIVLVSGATGDTAQQLERGVFALHSLCSALMKHKPMDAARIICWQQPGSAANTALHGALAGYLKSLVLENPKFSWKVVAVDGYPGVEQIAALLAGEVADEGWRDSEVRYRCQDLTARREVKQIQRYTPRATGKATSRIKQNGVYIVTGGLGGLGYIFSEHLAKQYGARLVLSGRSALNEAQRGQLAALKAHGAQIIYVQADVSDPDQADALAREARHAFSRIDGVIHSAGIHRDAFVINKPRAQMESVLAAKVAGTLNLDRATQDDDLDLFVLFSSVAGALGNAGQSDYAYANGFMDAYAEQRQAMVKARTRFGKTLSINWPLWEDGGMRISQGDIALLEARSGISPLPTAAGIAIWEVLLQADETQAMAIYGDADRIESYLARVPAPAAPVRTRSADSEALRDATEDYLKVLLGEQIKLAVERIDSQERFESFGVDSMMISRINADLERDLGSMPKTLFYEYATIEELAGYLLAEANDALRTRFAMSTALEMPTSTPTPMLAAPVAAMVAQAPVLEEKIAIIGMHGQFPRSESLAQYWDNLKHGRDLTGAVPPNRWDADALQDKIYCKWGGFLDGHDKFDAAFFGISADDASLIDPQERLFIESVWACVEDAGYTRDTLKKRHPKAKSADVGVFVGVTTNTYHLLAAEQAARGHDVTPASLPWSIANRVSYFFDFQGPSMPVDTACSSALVAIHMASESLRRGECQVAVAGGVNLYLHPSKYQSLCRRNMLARDGACRSYGDGDDGFIPGEGVGAFLLKPVSRAIADHDHIYGVIAASACEHSGRANGYSAPNPNSQSALIQQALGRARIGAEDIGYVEGHGTGTQIGDSLEVLSLTQAFRSQKRKFCPLGSVKANVGHSESAAGIAGVAKVLLQFKHGEIAPTIHSEKVNPNIDFDNSPFYLQHALTPWPARDGQPRRALINSFGAGGVNACVILEQYQAQASIRADGPYLLLLSAKDQARLTQSAALLRDYVGADGDIDLGRLSYTLQAGREAMDVRIAVQISSAGELLAELDAYLAGAPSARLGAASLAPQRKKKAPNQEARTRARALFENADLDALARMWIEGQMIDWDELHGASRPRRLPLPTYPFAKDRHWVAEVGAPAVATAAAQLHPLVWRNASTLKEVCFASVLSGEQYYGRDHRVNAEMFFPGAGFLEMACVSGAIAGEATVTGIEDIVWVQPLRLTPGEHQVSTILKANGSDAEFVIVSFDHENERVVHAEGRLMYGAGRKHTDPPGQSYSIAQLKQRAETSIQGAACYQRFEQFGFHYGPSFQTIQELHIGSGFVLSKLDLSAQMKESFDQYLLHPCIIDGALQTVIGMAAGDEPDTPFLPFALDQVQILLPLAETCYAYVEPALPQGAANPDIRQFNIRLLSENGDLLACLNNFCVRALRTASGSRRDGADSLASSK